jgi:HK97 family phage prohead protease
VINTKREETFVGKREYDFAGWVTKNDVRCSDGVTIKHDAFKDNDGQKVPLVWNHDYNSPNNVLGHVLLQNHESGVYGYGFFNATREADNAKEMVNHGDISSMSIGARKLKRVGADVVNGSIYEVSLVLAGANPGAMIETVMQHSDGDEEKAYITTGARIHSADDILDDKIELKHNDESKHVDELKHVDEDLTIGDIIETMTNEQKDAVYALLGMVAGDEDEEGGEAITHSDEEVDTIQEVLDTMNDEQLEAVYALVGMVSDEEEDEDQNTDNDEKGDDETMKQNVFNKAKGEGKDEAVLKHSLNEVLKQASTEKVSSLKDFLAAQQDTLTHGINSIDMLFPDAAQSTNGNVPILYKDPNTGYQTILSRIAKSPFSRVKTTVADLTEDEARAKGYIKGNMKKEEFFSLIKRHTTPTTVYKKQKLDRDDVLDITDFDVVAFMNVEMRMMLEEEIARAALVGDGRDFSSDDKINEQNIRPILGDHEFFTIHKAFADAGAFIEAVIKAMSEYRGSGNPDMYIDPTLLADVKLLKGTDGRFLFGDIPSNEAIANRLGLREIIPTTFMAGKGALIVNLRDYTLGAAKGGQVTSFDDFDIDFNQHKYLIETRLCGALTMPKSAIHLNLGVSAGTGATDSAGGMTYGERQADKLV